MDRAILGPGGNGPWPNEEKQNIIGIKLGFEFRS